MTAGTVRNMLIDSGKAGIKWTSSTLVVYNIDLSSAGFYRCVAVNTLDGAIVRKSGAAYLNVLREFQYLDYCVFWFDLCGTYCDSKSSANSNSFNGLL